MRQDVSWKTTGLVLLAIVAVAVLAISLFRRTPLGHEIWPPPAIATVSDLPVFNVPAGGSFDLLVRPSKAIPGAYLISRLRQGSELRTPKYWPVYRYLPGDQSLKQVPKNDWVEDGGSLTPDRTDAPERGLGLKEVNGVATVSGPQEPPNDSARRGEYIVHRSQSPDNRHLAILSADGPKRPKTKGRNYHFGTFGGGFYGQHYVEVFRVPEMVRIGEPRRVVFTSVDGKPSVVWSPDSRIVIYSAPVYGTPMCVVHAFDNGVSEEGQTP